MLYIVLLEDNPAKAEERARHTQAHLAFLEANAAHIKAAGPLKEAASGDPAGGLWLVTADEPGAVQGLVEADPFWPTGLRKSVRILAWTQVFAEGARRI